MYSICTIDTASVAHQALFSIAQVSLITIHVAIITLGNILTASLWITGFLSLLNVALAVLYRKRKIKEVASYYAAFIFEVAIFLFALLFRMGVIAHVPFPLPPGLPFNRAEIGAALAIGVGLFPATFWHSTSFSEIGARIAADAKTMNDRDGGVKIGRKNAPGEWMN